MFAPLLKIDHNVIEKKYSQFSRECKCQNCGFVPEKTPIRRFNCKSCGRTVFIKKYNGKTYFLTEEQFNKFTMMRDFDSTKYKYLQTLYKYEPDEKKLFWDFDQSNIRNIDELKDYMWATLNNLLLKFSNDSGKLSMIYLDLSTFDSQERDGALVYELQKKFFHYKLESFIKSGGSNNALEFEVKIISAPTNPECYKDHLRTLSLNDAVAKQILPHKVEGNKHGCCCTYSFSAKRDAAGDLIWKD